MSEISIDILERRMAIHIQRRADLYQSLREVEMEIDQCRLAISRHIARLHDSHVVEPDESVAP